MSNDQVGDEVSFSTRWTVVDFQNFFVVVMSSLYVEVFTSLRVVLLPLLGRLGHLPRTLRNPRGWDVLDVYEPTGPYWEITFRQRMC
jgi:hypothetical protein